MSWKRKLGIGLGLAVLAVVLLATYERWTGERRLRELRARLSAQGETFDWKALAPPQRKAEENGYRATQEAYAEILQSEWLWEHYPGFPLTSNGAAVQLHQLPRPFLRRSRSSTETNELDWAGFHSRVSQWAEPLRRIRSAVRSPALTPEMDYSSAGNTIFRHLVPLKTICHLLNAAALSAMHNGLTGAAVENLESTLLVSEHLRQHPSLISQLVHLSVYEQTAQSAWQLIHSPAVNEKELTRLQAAWSKTDPGGNLPRALGMERIWIADAIRLARTSNSNFLAAADGFLGAGAPGSAWTTNGTAVDFVEFIGNAPAETGRALRALLWRSLFAAYDEATTVELLQQSIDLHRAQIAGACYRDLAPKLASLQTEVEALDRSGALLRLRTQLSQATVAVMTQSFRRVFKAEANRRLVIAACALRRYQVRNGRYPDRFETLAPEFIPDVVRDPYDGHPLRYVPLSSGRAFLLYSVGSDLKDDHGVFEPKAGTTSPLTISAAFNQGPDIVWPATATDAEAAEFWTTFTTKPPE